MFCLYAQIIRSEMLTDRLSHRLTTIDVSLGYLSAVQLMVTVFISLYMYIVYFQYPALCLPTCYGGPTLGLRRFI